MLALLLGLALLRLGCGRVLGRVQEPLAGCGQLDLDPSWPDLAGDVRSAGDGHATVVADGGPGQCECSGSGRVEACLVTAPGEDAAQARRRCRHDQGAADQRLDLRRADDRGGHRLRSDARVVTDDHRVGPSASQRIAHSQWHNLPVGDAVEGAEQLSRCDQRVDLATAERRAVDLGVGEALGQREVRSVEVQVAEHGQLRGVGARLRHRRRCVLALAGGLGRDGRLVDPHLQRAVRAQGDVAVHRGGAVGRDTVSELERRIGAGGHGDRPRHGVGAREIERCSCREIDAL